MCVTVCGYVVVVVVMYGYIDVVVVMYGCMWLCYCSGYIWLCVVMLL